VVGTCECSNEPSGTIKCGEFLDLAENLLPSGILKLDMMQ
jgi:hypothetical protein